MVAYAGISNRVLGAVTVGRQDSFVKDALGRYDAMEAAKAFSLVGVSNIVAGAGDTENSRYNSSVQYRVGVGPFRLGALYQFGGYDQGNGSNGAFDAELGGDFGAFSFDTIGSKVKDAVALSNFGEYPLPSGVNPTDLKATLSDNTAGAAMAKYSYNIATVYGGFEYILFRESERRLSERLHDARRLYGPAWRRQFHRLYDQQDPAGGVDRRAA